MKKPIKTLAELRSTKTQSPFLGSSLSDAESDSTLKDEVAQASEVTKKDTDMPYLRTRCDAKSPTQARERLHQLVGHLGETYDEQHSTKLVMRHQAPSSSPSDLGPSTSFGFQKSLWSDRASHLNWWSGLPKGDPGRSIRTAHDYLCCFVGEKLANLREFYEN